MTPLQLANCHCDNYQADGSCLGMYYNRDLSVAKCVPLPRCLLHEPVQRCPYFEEIIVPMNLEDRSRDVQERTHKEFEEGVNQYREATAVPVVGQRLCVACLERNTSSKTGRLCDECRDQRRKETYRQSKRRSRTSKCPHSRLVSALL